VITKQTNVISVDASITLVVMQHMRLLHENKDKCMLSYWLEQWLSSTWHTAMINVKNLGGKNTNQSLEMNYYLLESGEQSIKW